MFYALASTVKRKSVKLSFSQKENTEELSIINFKFILFLTTKADG